MINSFERKGKTLYRHNIDILSPFKLLLYTSSCYAFLNLQDFHKQVKVTPEKIYLADYLLNVPLSSPVSCENCTETVKL